MDRTEMAVAIATHNCKSGEPVIVSFCRDYLGKGHLLNSEIKTIEEYIDDRIEEYINSPRIGGSDD